MDFKLYKKGSEDMRGMMDIKKVVGEMNFVYMKGNFFIM